MPIIFILLIAVVSGMILFFSFLNNMSDSQGGFKGFASVSFFVLPILVGSILWMTMANIDRVQSNESFHAASTIVQDDVNIQFIVGKHDDKISFVNLGDEFNGTVENGVFVRRYCWERYNYWVDFMITEDSYKYELIGTDHKRYEEVKKLVGQGSKE